MESTRRSSGGSSGCIPKSCGRSRKCRRQSPSRTWKRAWRQDREWARAPERYRTRGFRDLSRNFSDIVAAPATIELAKLPDTVSGVSGALAFIIDVAKKMQGICRRAKKNMKRLGSLYWSRLDNWDAMRRAI